ncbi:ice-binding family protein [Streptosporangium sp. NPDC023615]|uniref:ice-binding family protein n=1 Tax=Streptosporangium sp. NPDC023615 TaxID=3154794 RepID=UPI0034235193
MMGIGSLRAVPRKSVRSWLAGVLAGAVALGCVTATPGTAAAATPVPLGTAGNFAVLAGTTVTNTGPTVVVGDLGVSPGASVTGFPPGVVAGTVNAGDAVAAQAQIDLVAAYNNAAGQAVDATLPTELGGTTVTPGTYDSAAGTFGITGQLTLDGQGDPNAVFIFKTASTLTTASASTVNLINGAQACNVFWQVGSSATLGTGSDFAGNILALASITATTGVTVDGRLLARSGAVTLDTNTVTRSLCAADPPTTTAVTLAAVCSPRLAGRLLVTATVTSAGPTAPTGPVEFFSDGVSVGAALLDAGGQATLTVTGLAPGARRLVATFPGTAQLDPSASAPLDLVVGPDGLCPSAAPGPDTEGSDRASIRNHQHDGSVIKLRDRKRKRHRNG